MEKTIDPVDLHVGARIQARRVEQGLNQSQLGRALGLTFQQVQKYEKGTNRVSASKLYATAQFLGVPISYFFDGLDDLQAEPADTAYARRLRYIQTQQGAGIVDAYMGLEQGLKDAMAQIARALRQARA